MSGEFTSDQDLWQLAADFVAGGLALEEASRATRDATRVGKGQLRRRAARRALERGAAPGDGGLPDDELRVARAPLRGGPVGGALHVKKTGHPRDVVRTSSQALVTSGGQDSAVVAVGSSEHDAAIRAENATHGDLVMVPVKDAATNVTARVFLHYSMGAGLHALYSRRGRRLPVRG